MAVTVGYAVQFSQQPIGFPCSSVGSNLDFTTATAAVAAITSPSGRQFTATLFITSPMTTSAMLVYIPTPTDLVEFGSYEVRVTVMAPSQPPFQVLAFILPVKEY